MSLNANCILDRQYYYNSDYGYLMDDLDFLVHGRLGRANAAAAPSNPNDAARRLKPLTEQDPG